MNPTDWSSVLTDAGTIALLASAIVVAIQVIKTLYYKLPWGWVQKTPREVWFVLSVLAGIGVAIAFNYQTLMDTGVPLLSRFGTVLYGLTIGAGSKIVYAIASTAGAKFGTIKLDNEKPPTPTDTVVTSSEPCNVPEQAPVLVEAPAPIIPVQELATPTPPEVIVVKRLKDKKIYVIVDNKKYDITAQMLELDIDSEQAF
jgi:hypothetical protein